MAGAHGHGCPVFGGWVLSSSPACTTSLKHGDHTEKTVRLYCLSHHLGMLREGRTPPLRAEGRAETAKGAREKGIAVVIGNWPSAGTQMNKAGGRCKDSRSKHRFTSLSSVRAGRNSVGKLWWWYRREDWAMPCAQKAKNNLQKKSHMSLQPPPFPVSMS